MMAAAVALMLALPALAAAQDAPRTGRGMPRMNTIAWLLESKSEFTATAEQVAGIEKISKKFDAETAQLRADMQKVRDENMGGDRQAMMEKMRPLRDELRKKDEAAVADVLKLLSPDQQKTVNALLAKRRAEMRGGRMRN